MPLAAWFASLVPGLTKRVLAALGFGVVVVTGVNAIYGQLEGYIYSSLGQIPSSVLLLLNLGGLGDGLNIVIGAVAARIGLYVLTNSSRIIGI